MVQILNDNKINNASALIGGTAAWQKAGYPMAKGIGSKSKKEEK